LLGKKITKTGKVGCEGKQRVPAAVGKKAGRWKNMYRKKKGGGCGGGGGGGGEVGNRLKTKEWGAGKRVGGFGGLTMSRVRQNMGVKILYRGGGGGGGFYNT